MQGFLFWCIISEFSEGDAPNNILNGLKNVSMFIAKFVMAYIMHFEIQSMFLEQFKTLKFFLNHPDMFDYPIIAATIIVL